MTQSYNDAVRAAVAQAPPLTPEQRTRIAAILKPLTSENPTERHAEQEQRQPRRT